MSNNSSPIKNAVNDSINSIGNNSNVAKYREIANQQREKLGVFLGEHGGKVAGVIVILVLLFIYFFYIFRRIPRSINRMERIIKKYTNAVPIEQLYPCEEGIGSETGSGEKKGIGKYVLSDFYVNCSYKSYLPCTNYFDYSSIKTIEKLIKNGIRFIDIDVMNKDFNSCTEPVVCYGKEVGNWQYTNQETFRNVINTISLLAFSHHVTNMTDPFYLNINLHELDKKDHKGLFNYLSK